MNPEGNVSTPWYKSTKFLIAVIVLVVVIVGVVVALLFLNTDKSGSDNTSSTLWQSGSCPDELSSVSGKVQAVSGGKSYELSQETHAWVQANCKGLSNAGGSSASGYDTTPPVLKNLGVEFGPFNSATKTAGDFLFTQDALRDHLKGFFEFGALVNASGKKILPNLEYGSLVEGTKIIAVADGYVVNVTSQPGSNDYSVHVLVNENSSWEIAYDHITDPQVKRGETLSAGDTIGQVAQQNNGLFRSELQIQQTKNGVVEYACPLTLLDPAVKNEFVAKMKTLQSDWEAFAGRDLYNEASQPIAGCNYETLTDAKMAELTK